MERQDRRDSGPGGCPLRKSGGRDSQRRRDRGRRRPVRQRPSTGPHTRVSGGAETAGCTDLPLLRAERCTAEQSRRYSGERRAAPRGWPTGPRFSRSRRNGPNIRECHPGPPSTPGRTIRRCRPVHLRRLTRKNQRRPGRHLRLIGARTSHSGRHPHRGLAGPDGGTSVQPGTPDAVSPTAARRGASTAAACPPTDTSSSTTQSSAPASSFTAPGCRIRLGTP